VTETAAADQTIAMLEVYVRERLRPHPLLNPCLATATHCVTGPEAFGAWDEQTPLQVTFILEEPIHAGIASALREKRLWHPGSDFRVLLPDREPFRRFPGAQLRLQTWSELAQEFRFEIAEAIWSWRHAAVGKDPHGRLEGELRRAEHRFAQRLEGLRCEHYYRFRRARQDLLSPRLRPGHARTLLAIRRGEAVREALRLAFLAEGRPYPPDPWLEWAAERETRAGERLLAAVHSLLAGRDPRDVDHAGKVLRDGVVQALQRGGVSAPWLEQWWTWPAIAPPPQEEPAGRLEAAKRADENR